MIALLSPGSLPAAPEDMALWNDGHVLSARSHAGPSTGRA